MNTGMSCVLSGVCGTGMHDWYPTRMIASCLVLWLPVLDSLTRRLGMTLTITHGDCALLRFRFVAIAAFIRDMSGLNSDRKVA